MADIYIYPADRVQQKRSSSKRRSLGNQIVKLLNARSEKLAMRQAQAQKQASIKTQRAVIEQSESLVRQLRYELAKMMQSGGGQ